MKNYVSLRLLAELRARAELLGLRVEYSPRKLRPVRVVSVDGRIDNSYVNVSRAAAALNTYAREEAP